MYDWLEGWLGQWMPGRMAGWLESWLAGRVDRCLAGWKAGWLDGWLSGEMPGWMESWLDGWLSGWISSHWLHVWILGFRVNQLVKKVDETDVYNLHGSVLGGMMTGCGYSLRRCGLVQAARDAHQQMSV